MSNRSQRAPRERKHDRKPGPPTDWGSVADWYDQLVGESGSEYHQHVVIPGVLRLLGIQAGAAPRPAARPQAAARERVLDVACGQGVLCRVLHAAGAEVTGVDASPELLRAARQRSDPAIRYVQADARDLSGLPEGHFTAATLILAVQNIHPLPPLFASIARCLGGLRAEASAKSGGMSVWPSRVAGVSPAERSGDAPGEGVEDHVPPPAILGAAPYPRLVIVMMHPCFRGPKATSWGWDEAAGVQFRRVDRYLVPRKEPIVTHPGKNPGQYTWTFHRPLQTYAKALRGAGLFIDAIEEWPSHKMSQPGPRASAENTARKEIPMFLVIRAVKIA